MPAPSEARQRDLQALAERRFDLVIVGGGINGAGIARDAALRGLSVALVEMGDFASGTSSKSTKLVHGGLRYLEHGQVRLVFESVNERATLMRLAPHLVRAQEFLVPSYRGMRPGLFVLDCGLWLYDALSGFTSPKVHRTFRTTKVNQLEPGLRTEGLRGGIVYYDCATDDARLTLENILDARALGAVALNHVRATRLLREHDRFVGIEAVDCLSGQGPITVRGQVVINATGPWSDELRALYGADAILRPTKGVHIVVDHARLPVGRALTVREAKRVVFIIPWASNRTVIGTTDTFYEGRPEDALADDADVAYLLEVANHYFPEARLGVDDVISTWAGLRPLLRPPEAADASAVSREHHLETLPGLVTVAGGKLTTYRRMAAEVVDHAAEQLRAPTGPSSTGARPLPGGRDLEDASGVARVADQLKAGLPSDIAEHLASTYGARAPAVASRIGADPSAGERLDPELPFIVAEVDEAVEVEQASTLPDLLERRMPLSLQARDQGLGVAERVARRMGTRLGWDDSAVARELARYHAAIESTRRYRRTKGGTP